MHFDLEILINIWRGDAICNFISCVVFKAYSEEAETEQIIERTLASDTEHVGSFTWGMFFLGFLH